MLRIAGCESGPRPWWTFGRDGARSANRRSVNCIVLFVVLACGCAVPSAPLTKSPAVLLAQGQLDAYNARDLERFAAFFAPDVEIYDFPDKLVLRGRDAFRARYGPYFAAAKKLHARLVGRLHLGRFVLDQEDVVTSIPGRERIAAIAIYETSGGVIRRVWFIR